MSKLRIAVTGDTGYDVYTEYVKGYRSKIERLKRPEAAVDFEAPSGAESVAIALQQLIGDCADIEHLQPRLGADNTTGFSTLQKFLVELHHFDDVLRIKQLRPINDKFPIAEAAAFHDIVRPDKTQPMPNDIDVLVIHDGAGVWRNYPDSAGDRIPKATDAMSLVKDFLRRPSREVSLARRYITKDVNWPTVLVNLSHDLPTITRQRNGSLVFDKTLTFWRTLARFPADVCVICSADALRREGASLSRRLSLEQTIEDLALELMLFDKLAGLAHFKHLIVRFGMVAAVHITTAGRQRTADLVFAPAAKGGIYRDPPQTGVTMGKNAFLLAALAAMIANRNPREPQRAAFTAAIKAGLQASMLSFDAGYTNPVPGRLATTGRDMIEKIYGAGKSPITKGYSQSKKAEHILGHTVVPPTVLAPSPLNRSGSSPVWEILRNSVDSNDADKVSLSSSVEEIAPSRLNIGAAIVLFGREKVLNREWSDMPDDEDIKDILRQPACRVVDGETPDHMHVTGGMPNPPTLFPTVDFSRNSDVPLRPIYVPVATFGRLTVIERREIESFRSIRNLFKTYLEECSRAGTALPPIAIAVFGPPGSGKSFAVKEIARDINSAVSSHSWGLEPIEYNVAQFRTVDELGEAITRASIINNEGKVPLVFCDEFDCNYGGKPLGWLKYLLAPMQDGIFYGAKQTIKIARAIFVFAGGLSASFDQFDPSTAPPGMQQPSRTSDESKKLLDDFKDQKGPDFISRLRGHIDILPINASAAEEPMPKPIIRRAIILRALLERKGFVDKVGNNWVANIDEDVLYALLTARQYRHGTRSMEAILDMCSRIDGRIEKASLPSKRQLHMHVDADEFFIWMQRGRSRRSPIARDRKGALIVVADSSATVPAGTEVMSSASSNSGPTSTKKPGTKSKMPPR